MVQDSRPSSERSSVTLSNATIPEVVIHSALPGMLEESRHTGAVFAMSGSRVVEGRMLDAPASVRMEDGMMTEDVCPDASTSPISKTDGADEGQAELATETEGLVCLSNRRGNLLGSMHVLPTRLRFILLTASPPIRLF